MADNRPWKVAGSIVYRTGEHDSRNTDELHVVQLDCDYHNRISQNKFAHQLAAMLNTVSSAVDTTTAELHQLFIKQLEAQIRVSNMWVDKYKQTVTPDSNKNHVHGAIVNATLAIGKIGGMLIMHRQLFRGDPDYAIPDEMQIQCDRLGEVWTQNN